MVLNMITTWAVTIYCVPFGTFTSMKMLKLSHVPDYILMSAQITHACKLLIVYTIILAYIYFRDLGLGAEICEGIISHFSDVFITINRHKLKWKFSRGLTHKICENKNHHLYSISHDYEYQIQVNKFVGKHKFS